jgi:hypothetical protein
MALTQKQIQEYIDKGQTYKLNEILKSESPNYVKTSSSKSDSSNNSGAPTYSWYTTPTGKQVQVRDGANVILDDNGKYLGVRQQNGKATYAEDDISYRNSNNYSNNENMIIDQNNAEKKKLLAQLKASIAKAKAGYTDIINKAPQTYQPLRNQNEVSREQQLASMREALANQGNAGGTGRQELLNINTAAGNRMNDINLQQQNVINDANSAISNLDEQAAFKESEITADMASQKLQALLAENARVDELNREQTEKAEELKTKMTEDERQRFIDTIGRYSNDYTAQRNLIANDGDTSNDWQIPYLENAANQKRADAQAKFQEQGYVSEDIRAALGLPIGTMTEAYKLKVQEAAKQTEVQNALKLFDQLGYVTPQIAAILSAYGLPVDAKTLDKIKADYTVGKPYSGGSGGGSGGSGIPGVPSKFTTN